MPRKPNPPPTDAEQSKRFIDAAEAAVSDKTGELFESALDLVVPPKTKPPKSKTEK